MKVILKHKTLKMHFTVDGITQKVRLINENEKKK